MRRLLIVTLLLAAGALPLAAQSLSGTVTGTVRDEGGGVLPGVNITLAGKAAARSTVTDAEGNFRFAGVDPGTYTVTAEMSSFRPKRQDNVVVGIGRVVDLPLSLTIGGLSENVEVVGEAPLVDASSSSTDNALSQDMLFNLPIRPTNAATSLLDYTPGVNDGSAFGGNSGYGNGLLVDGVDTRDPDAGSAWTFFNFNIVDEVQVGGVGAPAEYGAYTGAVVNTVTKSGGNRYQGLFDIYWTTTDFSANNVSAADEAANPALSEPAVINKRLDLTGQLSGPIIKDKLFFFLSGQRYQQIDNPSGPVGEHTEMSPRFNTKITWQPGPNDNITANFQWDYYNQTGRRTGWVGPSSTQQQTENQDSPEAIWGLQWRHIFSPKTFAEVKYTGWWGYYNLDPLVTQPLHYDSANDAYSGGAPYFYYADRTRNQVNASLSHFAEAFGNHDLKFGIQVERSTVHSRYGYNQGLYYYDNTADYPKGQYYAYDYGYDLQGTNHSTSLYAQDSWKPTSRLTINAGVRVDFVSGNSPVLDTKVYSQTNWAPRIGAAYDLTGDGKTVLKGHYGQYYDGIYFQNYAAAVPGMTKTITYVYDPEGSKCGPAGNCFTEDSRRASPLYAVDPDMKHPRVDEWTVGFDRALTKDFRLSVTGIWRQDKNVQGSVYPDARWQQVALTTATSSEFPSLSGVPATAYKWTNQSDSEETPLLTNPQGFQYLDANGQPLATANTSRKYKGLMVVLDKRFSDRWQARVSYVWSESKGYISNNSINTFGQKAFFETPTLSTVNTYGPTTYDTPNEIKVMGTYQIPKIELGVSAYYRYLSGTTYAAYQRFSRSQVNWPSSTGRQPYIEARGDRRLPDQSYLDLRVEKFFDLGAGASRIAVFGDLQNVFNKGTVTDANGRYPTVSTGVPTSDPNVWASAPIDFAAPTELYQPRRFLLGARWSF
jgi:hypothetical protein